MEVQLQKLDTTSKIRIGFASLKFDILTSRNEGMGCDAQSWAVDGVEKQFLHGGQILNECMRTWKVNDLIGLHYNSGILHVSVHGERVKYQCKEVLLDSFVKGEKVDCPVFSASDATIRINLGIWPYQHVHQKAKNIFEIVKGCKATAIMDGSLIEFRWLTESTFETNYFLSNRLTLVLQTRNYGTCLPARLQKRHILHGDRNSGSR
jgi:hypothetical protein